MHHVRRATAILALSLYAARATAADPLPLTDNTAAPYIGAWKSGDDYARWLGRSAVWRDVSPAFKPVKTWDELERAAWIAPDTDAWAAAAPEHQVVTSVQLLPLDGSTLAQGAAGAYDAHFAALARTLVARHLATAIICPSPCNEGRAPWCAVDADGAEAYVRYWRHLVATMRAVPGAERLRFDWVGANERTSFPVALAYPGDDCVDVVGMVLYDLCWDTEVYPPPPGASAEVVLAHQRLAWERHYLPAAQNGLATWLAVAKAHGKPFSLPSWGLYADHHLSTGGDNPWFIRQVHDFIRDPGNHVLFATYFEYYHASRLAPTGGYVSTYPVSTALFQQLFSVAAVSGAAR